MADKAAAPKPEGGKDIEAGRPLIPKPPKRSMFGNMSPGGQACLKATITIIALLILTVIITVATPSDVLTRLTNLTPTPTTAEVGGVAAAKTAVVNIPANQVLPTAGIAGSMEYAGYDEYGYDIPVRFA